MVSLIDVGLPKYNYRNSQIIKTTESGESITSTTDRIILAVTLLWSLRTKALSAQSVPERQPLGLALADNTASKVSQT